LPSLPGETVPDYEFLVSGIGQLGTKVASAVVSPRIRHEPDDTRRTQSEIKV
jgi:hypothetical protein